jgi:hypothetical protein
MNKAIAEVFGWVIGALHVVAVVVVALFPIERFVGLGYIPSVWFGKALVLLVYVAIFGSISVLISINDHLRDINAKLGGGALGEGIPSRSGRRIEPE